jgi:hypothetical protein
MRRWPWITLILAVLVAISPLGREVLEGAFVSGEQLSRSISQFMLAVGLAMLAGLALLEWLAKWLLTRRRAARGSRTES